MLTVDFNPFPKLTTERLVLRPVSHEDADAVFSLRSDSRVMEYLDRPLAKTIEDAHELIGRIEQALKHNEGITWAITLKTDPKLIGTIGFWQITKEHFRAEIGYLLHPDWQGKGLMQEAISKVIDYGFNNLRLHSVEANVNPGNQASIRLLERNHFTREAHFKENYYYNGKFLDTVIYSRLTGKTEPGMTRNG
jgi:[ribosomal protein S5]-alanine N-acetyltransferase